MKKLNTMRTNFNIFINSLSKRNTLDSEILIEHNGIVYTCNSMTRNSTTKQIILKTNQKVEEIA